MKEKFKDKFFAMAKEPRIILLLCALILSFFLINFAFDNSNYVVIDGVAQASIAQNAGMNFDSESSLRSYERIYSVNSKQITSVEDYYLAVQNESSLSIITNKATYNLKNVDNSSNWGISVREAPSSNLHLGMEFEGGSRFIIEPNTTLTDSQYQVLADSLQSRLDIYGVSGTKVEKLKDPFSDKQLLIVESTSSNKNDIVELINRQGNFEAKVGNVSVFTADDILSVFTDAKSSRFLGCEENENGKEGYTCSQTISFSISDEAATRFYDACANLSIEGNYLSKKVYYYLDGKEIINLSIASDFKHKKIYNHAISFPGSTLADRDVALASSVKEKKFLTTILSTKSLPSKLNIVQSYSISSSMGQEFLSNALLVSFLALLAVAGTIALRYRQFSIFIGIIIALLSEIIILLGIAVFFKISIDLAAIGGIIAAIGTGVDDQVIITDEQLRKKNKGLSSRKKLKAALLIIMISYLTTIAAMFPLLIGGLSMLKGFAFMIILGVSIGVFITRPVYAKYLRIVLTTKEEREEEEENEKENS